MKIPRSTQATANAVVCDFSQKQEDVKKNSIRSGEIVFFAFFLALFFQSASLAQSSSHAADRPPSASHNAAPQLSPAEQLLFDNLNHERTSRGLAALHWDLNLAEAARIHCQRMADANTITHQLPGEPDMQTRITESGARFSVVAENVAVGPNPATVHDGWMHSPGHRANILDPQLTAVGIAAVRTSGGLFAVQDFSRAAENLSLEQQEKRVSSLAAAMGFTISSATADARKNCDSNSGISGVNNISIIRFETSDLSKIPDDVAKKMKSHGFRNAAIGACPATGAPGFSHFRIAIVLY